MRKVQSKNNFLKHRTQIDIVLKAKQSFNFYKRGNLKQKLSKKCLINFLTGEYVTLLAAF